MSSQAKKGGARGSAGASAPPGGFEAFLCMLYPAGIRPEQYPDVLAVVRILDKRYGAQRVEEERKKPLSHRPLRKRKRKRLLRSKADVRRPYYASHGKWKSSVPHRGRPRRG